jgi:hypothetical protein
MNKRELRLHATYSNGAYGSRWSVRQVLDIGPCENDPGRECVTYKVLAGPHRRSRHTVGRDEFERWMKYEVVCHETHWLRANQEEKGL